MLSTILCIVTLPSLCCFRCHTIPNCSLDFSYVFKYRLGKCSEFVAQFPMKEDHLDFHSLAQLNAQGKYDIKSATGFETFFADLLRMVANGKQFNECNRGFQVTRLHGMSCHVLVPLHNLSFSHLSLRRKCSASLRPPFSLGA